MPMPQKAIIFDLDGTLLDTLEDLADATNTVLSRRDLPPHPVNAYRRFVGSGARELIRRALPPDQRTDAIIRECHRDFMEVYACNWNTKTRPYPGIPELLDRLAERKIKTAILSNKPHNITVKTVETLLAPWHFEIVLGQRDGIPRKPDPAGALEIAHKFGKSPAEVLFLGDSDVDMRTSANAGMFAVGATWGFRSEEELLGAGAQALAKRPQETLAFFEKMSSMQ